MKDIPFGLFVYMFCVNLFIVFYAIFVYTNIVNISVQVKKHLNAKWDEFQSLKKYCENNIWLFGFGCCSWD